MAVCAMTLREAIAAGRALLGGGPWGTALRARGLRQNASADAWNVERPAQVSAVARGYAAAGADYLITNTFQGTRPVLARYQFGDDFVSINQAGVRIAREALAGRGWVIATLGPPPPRATGAYIDAMAQQAAVLCAAEPDALLLETCGDAEATAAASAILAAASPLPVIVSFAFHRSEAGDYRTFTGATPAQAAAAVPEDALAWGANCALGPAAMIPLAQELHALRPEIPLLIAPCAGSTSVAVATPPDFAAGVAPLRETGAQFIGACCGADAAHIRAMRKALA